MTARELEARLERARTETFVIARSDRGFRIHSPTTGGGPYLVDSDARSCTCKDFELHRGDPEWRCKHILAVRERHGGAGSEVPEPKGSQAPQAAETTRAAPDGVPGPNGSRPLMLIKRSVSPDGRIDSLSVEFSCPVEALSEDAEARAREILEAQSGIVRTFLGRENGRRPDPGRRAEPGPRPTHPRSPDPEHRAGIPAQLLKIGGAEGNWGRRLFMTVQANGRALRLYGSRQQLADHLEAAGYPDHAGNVREGVRLNLPCRIVTSESEDGFVSVEEVLPPARNRSAHRPIH